MTAWSLCLADISRCLMLSPGFTVISLSSWVLWGVCFQPVEEIPRLYSKMFFGCLGKQSCWMMTNFPVRFNPSVEFVHLCIVSCVKQSVPPEAVQNKIAATSMFDALGGAAYFLLFLFLLSTFRQNLLPHFIRLCSKTFFLDVYVSCRWPFCFWGLPGFCILQQVLWASARSPFLIVDTETCAHTSWSTFLTNSAVIKGFSSACKLRSVQLPDLCSPVYWGFCVILPYKSAFQKMRRLLTNFFKFLCKIFETYYFARSALNPSCSLKSLPSV